MDTVFENLFFSRTTARIEKNPKIIWVIYMDVLFRFVMLVKFVWSKFRPSHFHSVQQIHCTLYFPTLTCLYILSTVKGFCETSQIRGGSRKNSCKIGYTYYLSNCRWYSQKDTFRFMKEFNVIDIVRGKKVDLVSHSKRWSHWCFLSLSTLQPSNNLYVLVKMKEKKNRERGPWVLTSCQVSMSQKRFWVPL